MKQIKKIKKKLLASFLILEIIIFSTIPTHHVDAYIPVVSEIAGVLGSVAGDVVGEPVSNFISEFFENDLNLAITQLPIDQLNAIDKKDMMPQVDISFTGTVDLGEYITATANPTGLINPQDAYYSWYLIEEGEDPTDPEVINEGKIRAIKAMVEANSNFNPLLYDQKFNGGNENGKIDGDEWPETEFKVEAAFLGGASNRSVKEPRMYAWFDGAFSELGKAKKIDYGTCDEGFVPTCMLEFNGGTPCPILDPPVEGEVTSSSSSEGGGGGASDSSSATADGGSGGDSESDSSAKIEEEPTTSGGLRFSQCLAAGEPKCSAFNRGETVCPFGGEPYCAPTLDTDLGYDFYKKNTVCPNPHVVWKALFEEGQNAVGAECKDFEEDYLTKFECFESPDEEDDYEPYNDEEMHFFPRSGGDAMFGIEDKITSGVKLSFNMDPISVSTTKLGIPDIDLIRGKGMNNLKFKAIGENGKRVKVGVVVEGLSSNQTPHYDENSDDEGGGYMPVFAFMSGGCEMDKKDKGGYSIVVKGKEITVQTADMKMDDLNKCLANNLVDPGSSQSDPLNVKLTTNWDNIAVTVGIGNTIQINPMINSDSNRMLDLSRMNYKWNVTCSDNPGNVCEEGFDITKDLREAGNLNSKTIGNDLGSLKMLANNLDDKCFDDGGRGYLCTTLKANTNHGGDTTSFGMQSKIIPIQKSGGKLKAYSTTTDGQTVNSREEICKDRMNEALCRVVKGEIIGVEMVVPEGGDKELVSWTVNRVGYSCDSSVSNECADDNNTNKIFFPITGNIGESITIIANYNDPSETTHGYQSIQKTFQIVAPSISIKPLEGGKFKLLGKYLGRNKKEYEDRSNGIIEIQPDNSATLEAVFTPSFIESDTKITWNINGSKSYEKKLQIAPNLPNNVNLRATYTHSQTKKDALYNIFGVSQFNTKDTYMIATARLVSAKTKAIGKNKQNGFFATTASNTPAYFFFLLKMALMVSVMLFVSRLALNVASFNKR